MSTRDAVVAMDSLNVACNVKGVKLYDDDDDDDDDISVQPLITR
jgi:hypothetical protein